MKGLIILDDIDNIDLLTIMMKELELPQKQLDFTLKAINNIKYNVHKLNPEIRKIVVMLFVQDKTFQEIGELYGMSAGGLYKMIKKEIERV